MEKGRKVLVIEDDLTMAALLRVVLQRRGLEVLLAQDSPAGLKLAQQRAPDLVVCDFSLPLINGMGVLERLQRQPWTAAIPVLLMGTYHSYRLIAQCMHAGAAGFLVKPFTPGEFVEQVEQVLGELKRAEGRGQLPALRRHGLYL